MNEFNVSDTHIRYNPLSGEWILVSPGRLKRPWQAEKDKTTLKTSLPLYDKNCYMCPGNVRANGILNPDYRDTLIFDNDYPALIPDVEHTTIDKPIYRRTKTERGICRVICYSHEHNKTFSDLDNASIEKVIEKWIEQINELYSYNFINYIQIFENRGGVGNSNPHPHGQIWAVETIPDEIKKEINNKEKYLKDNGNCLICDIAKYEREVKNLVVFENDSFVTIVPFWAIWPFETLSIPKRHIGCLSDIDEKEKKDLARLLKKMIAMYDSLFDVVMPLSYGFHIKPKTLNNDCYHMHLHFYPTLLRSATVKKHMAGFEMLAEPQRDITPEFAAMTLRNLLTNSNL